MVVKMLFSKNIFLVVALFISLFPFQSLARIEWTLAGGTAKYEIFVDITSLKRDDDIVFSRELFRYAEKRKTKDSMEYQSVIIYVLYDCLKNQSSILRMTFHEDTYGESDVISEYQPSQMKWDAVRENSQSSSTMDIACNGTSLRIS